MSILGRVKYLLTFILIGTLMPFSILVAGAAALREKRRDERLRAQGGLSCSLDNECPTGFVCLNGRCVSVS
jgi:hypothetical protein